VFRVVIHALSYEVLGFSETVPLRVRPSPDQVRQWRAGAQDMWASRKEGFSVRTIMANKPIGVVEHDSSKRDTVETGKQW